MSAELSMVAGLMGTAFIFAYYGFQFRENSESFWSYLSIGFFLMSLVFLNLVMGALLLIAQNNAVSYLADSVIVWGLWITTMTTSTVLILFWLYLIWTVTKIGYEKLVGKVRGKAEY